jgi:ribosomal protein S18 acetylase RimI-like enzyme
MVRVSAPASDSLTLRDATPTDAVAITELIESAYRGPVSRQGWTTEADLLDGQRTDLDAVRDAIARDDVRLLVAIGADEVLLGCCQIERRSPELAYFGSFAVRPDLQNLGLGRVLLAAAESAAVTNWQSAAMEMTVIAQRAELIAWYRRRGYEPTGQTRPFPYGDERSGLPRREDLQFVVLKKPLFPESRTPKGDH